MVLKLGHASLTLVETCTESLVGAWSWQGWLLPYINRTGDYDKLWSVWPRFTTSNCDGRNRANSMSYGAMVFRSCLRVAIIHDWAWMSIWWKKTWRRSGRKHTRQVYAGVTRRCALEIFFHQILQRTSDTITSLANFVKYYATKILWNFLVKLFVCFSVYKTSLILY